MGGRLIDTDGAVHTVWHYDEGENQAYIQRLNPDVQPLLERNKRVRNNSDGYIGADRSMRHVASIDIPTYERWMQEAFGPGWMQRSTKEKIEVIKRRINDPDFQAFRTVDARI